MFVDIFIVCINVRLSSSTAVRYTVKQAGMVQIARENVNVKTMADVIMAQICRYIVTVPTLVTMETYAPSEVKVFFLL